LMALVGVPVRFGRLALIDTNGVAHRHGDGDVVVDAFEDAVERDLLVLAVGVLDDGAVERHVAILRRVVTVRLG
jgi:hypothetical protein